MPQGPRPRGHTGQKVEEPGTYRCGDDRTTWTYVPGDTFRPCPSTGKATVWEKVEEPDHADSR